MGSGWCGVVLCGLGMVCYGARDGMLCVVLARDGVV